MGSGPRRNQDLVGITPHALAEGMNGSQVNAVRVRTAGLWHGAADRLQSVLAPECDMAHAAAPAEDSHFAQPSHDVAQHIMARGADERTAGRTIESWSEEENTGQSRSTGSMHRSHLARDMVQG